MGGEGQVGLVKRTDGADVFPVVVEEVALELVAASQGRRDDLLAEVGGGGMVHQQIKQRVAAEHVDPHRRQIGLLGRFLSRQPQLLGIDAHGFKGIALGFFTEFSDAALGIGAHQPKAFGLLGIHRQGPHGELGAGFDVMAHELAVVHPVELVTGKNQVVVHIPFLEQPLVLAHGIGRPLEPTGAVGCLLGCQHLHKPLAKAGREVVGHRQVTIEGGTVELRQHIDLVDLGIDAIADRNINQSVFPCQGHGRLGPHFGEGVETGTGTASQNDGQNTLHIPRLHPLNGATVLERPLSLRVIGSPWARTVAIPRRLGCQAAPQPSL